MKALLKTVGAALAGLVLSVTVGRADTIVSVTETHYDAALRPDCVAVRMNTTTFADAPSSACVPKTTGALGGDRITKTTYDNAGRVAQVTQMTPDSSLGPQRVYSTMNYSDNGQVIDEIDANGNRTHMKYDGFDRLSEIDYPSQIRSSYNPSTQATALSSTANNYNTLPCDTITTSDCEAFQYDANGNRTWYRRRNSQVFAYTYDALNREILKNLPSNTIDVYTTYDLLGDVLSRRFDPASSLGVTYIYDGLGRVTSTTDMNGRTVSYQYTSARARSKLTLPDSTYVTYSVDSLNRVIGQYHSTGTSLFAIAYDSLGRRVKLNRGGSVAITNYTYDNLGRLNTFNADVAGTASDITWTFTNGYNPAGQIFSWKTSSTLYDYTETSSAVTNQAYDGLNRDVGLLSVTSDAYDQRGNVKQDYTRKYTYDVENRLLTKAPLVGVVDLTVNYDPEGRMSSYTAAGTTTTFLYDGTNLIREYSGATSTVLRTYVFGPGTDEPIVWFEGAGTTVKRFLVSNYQGSVIGYSDATGTMAAVYKYGAYGEPKDISNNESWAGARFRYTGQTMLFEAKLYYYKARVYDPVYGRFLQADPIGSRDDLNLYAYVGGDPVNRSDPTGLEGKNSRSESSTEKFINRQVNTLTSGLNVVVTKVVDLGNNVAQSGIDLSNSVENITAGKGTKADYQNVAYNVALSYAGAFTEEAVSPATVSELDVALARSVTREAPDWIVSSNGTAMRPTTAGNIDLLESVGFKGAGTKQTAEKGLEFRVGNTDIRIMPGGKTHGPRIVTTRAGSGKDYVHPNGQVPANGTSKSDRAAIGHTRLDK